MKYEVSDNVLSQEEFKLLHDTMLGPDFPWFYSPHKVGKNYQMEDNNLKNYQFTHNFYSDHAPKSNFISLLLPIINFLDLSAIVRIKANLVPVTDSIIEYPYHVDAPNFDGETAVFYVNSNNGYTVFKSGDKIDSVENRMLRFNAKLEHTGTSCTDQKNRCVINFNYYKWTS